MFGSHIKARFNIPHHVNRAPAQRPGHSLPRGAPQIPPTRTGRDGAGPHRAAGALLGQGDNDNSASPILPEHADAVTCSAGPQPLCPPPKPLALHHKQGSALCNSTRVSTNHGSKNCQDRHRASPCPAQPGNAVVLHVPSRGFKCFTC